MTSDANYHGRLQQSGGGRLLVLILVCLSLTEGLGCGSQGAATDAEADPSRIKELTTLYMSYMNRNGDRPPASEAEFKRFVAERGQPLFESAGVSAADELFVSPRDNEPYVILYGHEAAKLISRGIVIHERTGVGGRRLVGNRGGSVEEVDEAQFRKLVPDS
jgi:hypothetical protein